MHKFGLGFKCSVTGRCTPAARECAGSSMLPETSTGCSYFLQHQQLGCIGSLSCRAAPLVNIDVV